MFWLDRLSLELLAPLAAWVLISGIDDLFIDAAYLVCRLRAALSPVSPADLNQREARIAILVPCWQEAAVITSMLKRNLAAIRYSNYEFWIGLYPNDPETLYAVSTLDSDRVRYVVCAHNGPTTKADCLNQLLQGIFEHEKRGGRYVEIVLQHDAEDVIHPESPALVNRLCRRYDMVQLPVLPLPTAALAATHGAYGDEFSESHLKDLTVRSKLGGFIPSAGVGTALTRDALDRFRIENGPRIFDPHSLTEDYLLGLQAARLGLEQTFAAVRASDGGLVATRGYFPTTLRNAVRQRRRWVVGNCLQSWERFGWGRGAGQLYWLWRDRKGLIGHFVAALANLLFLYGLLRLGASGGNQQPSPVAAWFAASPVLMAVLWLNLALVGWRLAVRMVSTARVYGLRFALAVPWRAPWVNLLNFVSVTAAIVQYLRARFGSRPLRWVKTDHAFPASGHG